MDALQMLRMSGRRFAVVMSRDLGVPVVYHLHRVGSPEFLRLATVALQVAKTEAQDADELQARLLGAKTDADRERVTAELAAAAAERSKAAATAAASDPEVVRSAISQADALIMAAVAAVGIGRTDILLIPGLQARDATPADLCQPLYETSEGVEPVYLQPVRWASPGSASADTLVIGEINESERMELFGLIVEAFIPTKAAASGFRPGSTADSGSVGQAVQPKTKRAGAVRGSASGSDRSRGDGGG
jgi:hypothetical protein